MTYFQEDEKTPEENNRHENLFLTIKTPFFNDFFELYDVSSTPNLSDIDL